MEEKLIKTTEQKTEDTNLPPDQNNEEARIEISSSQKALSFIIALIVGIFASSLIIAAIVIPMMVVTGINESSSVIFGNTDTEETIGNVLFVILIPLVTWVVYRKQIKGIRSKISSSTGR